MNSRSVTFLGFIIVLIFLLVKPVSARPEGLSAAEWSSLRPDDREEVVVADNQEQILEEIGIDVVPVSSKCNVGSTDGGITTSYFSNVACFKEARALYPPGPGEVQYCRVVFHEAVGITFGVFFNYQPGFVSKLAPPFVECEKEEA